MNNVKTEKNIELAYELFSTLGIGGYIEPQNVPIIEKILNDCAVDGADYPDREKVLLKVIELASDNINSDSLYIISKAYSWAKVKYNKEAIRYLNLYLESGVSNYAISKTVGINNPESSRKYMHLADIYMALGEKYIIDYDYENALKSFNMMLENDELSRAPYGRQLPYLKIADTYRRMNRLDASIRTLEKAKYPENVFDKADDIFTYDIEKERKDFYEIIEKFLQDYKDKKERGYIYRPRNNKGKKDDK